MGKTAFSIILFVSSCLIAGCGNKTLELNNIQSNTMLITKTGEISAATVEEFDKPYYTEEGLKVFVEQQVGAYNKINGEEAVIIDSVRVKEDTASLLMTYKSIKDYANINHLEAENLTMEEAFKNSSIPEELLDASSGEKTTWEQIKENTKYRVVLINEPIDVIVNGKVKYYAGGVLLNESSVQSKENELCVIVYKP